MFQSYRPAPAARKFVSKAVDQEVNRVTALIADPELAWLFQNCFPNTLDTTVSLSQLDGQPDAFVITGDIDALCCVIARHSCVHTCIWCAAMFS